MQQKTIAYHKTIRSRKEKCFLYTLPPKSNIPKPSNVFWAIKNTHRQKQRQIQHNYIPQHKQHEPFLTIVQNQTIFLERTRASKNSCLTIDGRCVEYTPVLPTTRVSSSVHHVLFTVFLIGRHLTDGSNSSRHYSDRRFIFLCTQRNFLLVDKRNNGNQREEFVFC